MNDINEIKAQLTEEELEKLLAEKKKQKQVAEKKAREEYEKARDQLVNNLHETALQLNSKLGVFKDGCMKALTDFYARMQEYGDARGSKGNFTLFSNDGELKISYKVKQISSFDERADLAEEKLTNFLERFIKARNKKTYKLVMSLLERTNAGDFDINLINRLYKMENDFDDPDWTEAIKLFKESYAPRGTASYVTFHRRDEQGKFQNLTLNFSSI